MVPCIQCATVCAVSKYTYWTNSDSRKLNYSCNLSYLNVGNVLYKYIRRPNELESLPSTGVSLTIRSVCAALAYDATASVTEVSWVIHSAS